MAGWVGFIFVVSRTDERSWDFISSTHSSSPSQNYPTIAGWGKRTKISRLEICRTTTALQPHNAIQTQKWIIYTYLLNWSLLLQTSVQNEALRIAKHSWVLFDTNSILGWKWPFWGAFWVIFWSENKIILTCSLNQHYELFWNFAHENDIHLYIGKVTLWPKWHNFSHQIGYLIYLWNHV